MRGALSLKLVNVQAGRWPVRRPRSIICNSKSAPTLEDVAQHTLSLAYKPIVDVLERIEKKLDIIEKNSLRTRFVERPNGEIVKMTTLDPTKNE